MRRTTCAFGVTCEWSDGVTGVVCVTTVSAGVDVVVAGVVVGGDEWQGPSDPHVQFGIRESVSGIHNPRV